MMMMVIIVPIITIISTGMSIVVYQKQTQKRRGEPLQENPNAHTMPQGGRGGTNPRPHHREGVGRTGIIYGTIYTGTLNKTLSSKPP